MLSLLAGALLATAQYPPVEVHRLELAPGDTVVATEQGEGPAIVLVPGLLGNAFGFRHLAPALADAGYRTFIIEPLGTGNSGRRREADYSLEAQAARVGDALSRLGVTSAHFVCHSVGASICLRLALQQPQLVRGVVSLNGGPDERAATDGLRSALRFAPLIRLFRAGGLLRGKLISGLRENSADPGWVTDEVVAGYTSPFQDLDVTLNTLQAMARATEPESLAPRLPLVRAPVLMLLGMDSPEGAPDPQALAMLARVPRFQADTVPGAGQYPHEEQPELVVKAILQFVAGGAAPSPKP